MIFDRKQLDHYPMQPGVYLMKDVERKVIYVGKAKQLKVRLKQYFSASPDARPMVPYLVEEVAFIDTIVVDSEKEALLLENTLIKKHWPKYNAFLKDDKSYISLMINHRHPWPMLRLVRYKGTPQEEGLYFGPYTSAFAARQTYELLTRLFPLRQCSDEELKRRTRPCLLYGIKRCCAPCVQKCTREEYDGYVQSTIQFLRGQDKEMLKGLYANMQKSSQEMDFEKAAEILKMIRHIEHVIEADQLVVKVDGKDTDALAIYREGKEVVLSQLIFREGKLTGSEHFSFTEVAEDDEELLSSFILQNYTVQALIPEEILLPISLKDAPLIAEIMKEKFQKKLVVTSPQKGEKLSIIALAEKNAIASFKREKDQKELQEKMLLDLQETLKLSRYPKRIECFDTSHLSGQEPVAALIAFTEGMQDKKRTRLFRVKSANPGDEYGSLREVLKRHLSRAKQADDLPDLIIVDGGKGQLNAALEIFKELDIATVDIIAVAKQEGLHTKGMTQEKVFLRDEHDPIVLKARSHLLLLLQRIRDETHRKAISFHRTRRTKKTIASALDELPGIGPVKKTKLLRSFGSVERIKQATEEEILQVKGITKKDVAIIKKNLQ
jgi:excinuclease ABC subunit C